MRVEDEKCKWGGGEREGEGGLSSSKFHKPLTLGSILRHSVDACGDEENTVPPNPVPSKALTIINGVINA